MNYLLLRTEKGLKYARKITEQLRLFGNKAYIYKASNIHLAFQNHPEWNKDNLIIHSRAAHPRCNWMNELKRKEDQGYRVINNTEVLKLTSDKFDSVKRLQGNFVLPRTFKVYKGKQITLDEYNSIKTTHVVVKPRYSQGGGIFVTKLRKEDLLTNRFNDAAALFNCTAIVQECIDYRGIARIFCIGGKSLPVLTWDTPGNDWKVSVCLNQKQVTKLPDYVDKERITRYAERVQKFIGGEVNFIDVFWTTDNLPVLSEINTACSLLTHERKTNYNIARSIASYLNGEK